MNNKNLIITIDGPAASGKSTTARKVADELGYLYIDTGAMYRAVTLEIINCCVEPTDEPAVIKIAREIEIKLLPGKQGPRTLLNGKDVSEEIRLPKVSKIISIISAYKEVREIMKETQRQVAQHGGVVMDGRDIGTVVLPHAQIKIYMDASVDKRTDRRRKELLKKGINLDRDAIKNDIIKRDLLDSTRDVAPLKPAKDAYILDTSEMSISEQVEKVLEIVRSLN